MTVVVLVAISAVAPAVWLPQTPGYNDLALLAMLGIAAVMVRLMVPQSIRSVTVVSASLPLLIWVVFLAKWSAAVIVALLVVYPLFTMLSSVDPALRRRFGSVALVSGLTALASSHIFLEPLPVMSSGLREGLAALSGSHDAGDLLSGYQADVMRFLASLANYWWLLAALFLVAFLAERLGRRTIAACLFVGIVLFVVLMSAVKGVFEGGAGRARWFGTFIVLLLCVSVVMWMLLGFLGPDRFRTVGREAVASWSIVALLPLVMAVGTDNSIWSVAGTGATIWLSVMIALAFSTWGAVWPVEALSLTVAAAVAVTAVSGTWRQPYRQVPLAQTSIEIVDGPLRGLRVDAATAALVQTMSREIEPNSSVVVLWKQPGLVAAVDGVQPVHGWISDGEFARAAASIEAACRRPEPIVIVSSQRVLPRDLQVRLTTSPCALRTFVTRSVVVEGLGEVHLIRTDGLPG